ncbi:hypothetical protein BGZ63DRAFT_353313 [Mariannaea sp. PMI_226]|nr:hypothetical protein BGZ63DRAFT_353313 [Mariannaea sp. PMI_226]
MVEDEFLNVAHQFTVHLHHAEYSRLKNLAKTQNAATIQEIERPVVRTPTFLARQRRDRARRNAKQSGVLRESNEPPELPRTETGLRGLLESPRKEAKWISASAAGAATTRAAAGFGSNLSSPPKPQDSSRRLASSRKRQLPGNEDETTEGSDNDPQTPSRRLSTAKPMRSYQAPSSATSRSTAWPLSTPRAGDSSSTNNSPRPASRAYLSETTPVRPTTSRASMSSRPVGVENDHDDDPFGIKKRRIQRQQSREQFRRTEQKTPRKEPSPDNIPSFM